MGLTLTSKANSKGEELSKSYKKSTLTTESKIFVMLRHISSAWDKYEKNNVTFLHRQEVKTREKYTTSKNIQNLEFPRKNLVPWQKSLLIN